MLFFRPLTLLPYLTAAAACGLLPSIRAGTVYQPPFTISTYSGTAGVPGAQDGGRASARYNRPGRVALDTAGNFYIADTENHAIRKISAAGVVTTVAGSVGVAGSADGQGAQAQFHGPDGIAIDVSGIIYVGDTGNHTIRKITPEGVVTTVAGQAGSSGYFNGVGSSARFFSPRSVAVDSTGNIYVADDRNNAIRKISSDKTVTTLAGGAGAGSSDGTGSTAHFNQPFGLAVDGVGNVYVTDTNNGTIRKVTPTGKVTTVAGTTLVFCGSRDANADLAQFCNPEAIELDTAGNLYVVDSGNHAVRRIAPNGDVTTLAGVPGVSGSSDGTGSSAHFNYPKGIAVDSSGTIYIADTQNDTIRAGVVASPTPTPTPTPTSSPTATPSSTPTRTATPPTTPPAAGDLLVGEDTQVTRFSPEGGRISLLAGFAGVVSLAFDSNGNLFVGDTAGFNPGQGTIYKVTRDGTKSVFASLLFGPDALAFDGAGNLFEADFFSGSVFKFAANGAKSTFATGLYGPITAAFDQSGFLYVGCYRDGTIRKFAPDGSQTVFASGLTSGHGPCALAFDSSGNLFVADYGAKTIFRYGSTGGRTVFANNITELAALAFNSSGDLFVAADYDSVFQFEPDGTKSIFATGLQSTHALAFIPPLASPSKLGNIATRLAVQTGDNVLIGGFIITGAQPKKIIVRGIGPSLPFGEVLANPLLELHDGTGQLLEANDNWVDSPNKQAIIDSTIPPRKDLEPAIVRTLSANGSGYTAILRGVNNTTGIGVIEVYDLDNIVDSQLANISSRGLVQTGDNVLFAGMIVVGQATRNVIVRAIGPSLSIPGKLGDPMLELHDSNGTRLESNDNWIDSPNKQAIIDSTVAPTNDLEPAILRPLAPGNYTAVVSGANNTTGIAVVEVYTLN